MNKALESLKISINQGRLGHAFLFYGPVYTDKLAAAKEVMEFIKCDKLDFIMIESAVMEKNGVKKQSAIGLEDIKNLRRWTALKPYSNANKLAIINDAEMMTTEAANAFLKILEEPRGSAIFILIASFPDLLLPTIVSRCEKIKFKALPLSRVFSQTDFAEKYKKAAATLNHLARADLIDKYKYVKDLARDIALAREELNFWLVVFRDLIIGKKEAGINYSFSKLNTIIKAIKETNNLLANPSVNARLALEVLMLEF